MRLWAPGKRMGIWKRAVELASEASFPVFSSKNRCLRICKKSFDSPLLRPKLSQPACAGEQRASWRQGLARMPLRGLAAFSCADVAPKGSFDKLRCFLSAHGMRIFQHLRCHVFQPHKHVVATSDASKRGVLYLSLRKLPGRKVPARKYPTRRRCEWPFSQTDNLVLE